MESNVKIRSEVTSIEDNTIELMSVEDLSTDNQNINDQSSNQSEYMNIYTTYEMESVQQVNYNIQERSDEEIARSLFEESVCYSAIELENESKESIHEYFFRKGIIARDLRKIDEAQEEFENLLKLRHIIHIFNVDHYHYFYKKDQETDLSTILKKKDTCLYAKLQE